MCGLPPRVAMVCATFVLRGASAFARRPGLARRSLVSMSGGQVAGEAPAKVPVTLISGFLGSGKTSLLQHVLKAAESEADLKMGVVVNDMATVNIDAKLVRSPLDDGAGPAPAAAAGETSAEFVEIGDGCVCCSAADELFTTLSQLAVVSATTGYAYDHIVVEATGIAEPRAVRDQFQDADAAGIPLMDIVKLDTLVTVVDSAAFLAEYGETRAVKDRPDLAPQAHDQGRKMVIQRRFNLGVLEAIPKRKASAL